MNKLNLHAALFLCTSLLTGLTLILNANLRARLDQLPGAEVTIAPTPTQTPASYDPILYISFREGAPGSIFTLTGLSYRDVPNTKDAEEGVYMVHVQTPGMEKTESFRLDPDEPLRPPINPGPEFMIPAGIAFTNQELLPAAMW
jgi:hypothetical protein